MNGGLQFLPWFEENPHRLTWELAQFEARGWKFTVDQQELDRRQVVLRGQVPSENGTRHLAVVFPETYPEHRVEVYDLTGDPSLPLHQHPYLRNLCLLDNLPKAWTPDDYAAWMVERVLALYSAALGGEACLREIGVGAPEPQSYYYPYTPESALIIPEQFIGRVGDRGWFHLVGTAQSLPLHGLLAEVQTKAPAPASSSAPGRVVGLFQGACVRGAWFRIDQPPPWLNSAQEFFNWATSTIPGFERTIKEHARRSMLGDARLLPFGFVYPDQGPGGTHDQWLVGFLAERRTGKRWKEAPGILLRPFIFASADQELRIPTLAGLRGKRVAIIGLGTIGAPLALELGRTGLLSHMVLVDHDHFSIWNLVRHPLDLRALGVNKAIGIAQDIQYSSPMTNVEVRTVRIGDAPLQQHGGVGVSGLLDRLRDVDLIIDATADDGASRYLNRVSLRLGVPLIVASVTEGGWGGEVIRSIPGETGCYECYQWHMKENGRPVPSQDRDAEPVFTRGCGFPTFTGAGFDALSLAADAARLAT